MRKLNKRNGAWTILVDLWDVNPETGERKRRQVRLTFKDCKKAEAEEQLVEQLEKLNKGTFVEASKLTFGGWLDTWLDLAVKPPRKRLRTYESYKSIADIHLKPKLGNVRLQDLSPEHLERYYQEQSKTLSQNTLEHHHAVISGCIKSALRKRYIERDIALLVENKPKANPESSEAREHCWEAGEAREFLKTAQDCGTQPAAFYALGLDTGMRKGELCGLRWANLDLTAGTVTILEQLLKPGTPPLLTPPKKVLNRTIQLAPQTVELLRKHRIAQNELKLANRRYYQDWGLVFAKEYSDKTRGKDRLGDPLQMNNLGQREFSKIIEKAKVRKIKFHGMRHTCATLLLQAGIPVHVVSKRLGHKKVETTMEVYAHVLPSMQEEAAAKISGLLF